MKITSNVKGQLAVSKTELRALELGYLPSRPLFDSRYDLIIDNGEKLIRTQIKYADGKPSNTDGAVVVKLEYIDRQNKIYTYKDNEVDALIVYIPKVNKLCFFERPVFVGKRKLNIRLKTPKNGQKRRIIAAEDYYW